MKLGYFRKQSQNLISYILSQDSWPWMLPQTLILNSESDQKPIALETQWSFFLKGLYPLRAVVSLSESQPWDTAQHSWWEMILLIGGGSCCLRDGQKCIFKLKKYSVEFSGHLTLWLPRTALSLVSPSCSGLYVLCVITEYGRKGRGYSLRSSWNQKRWCWSQYSSTSKSSLLKIAFPISQTGFLSFLFPHFFYCYTSQGDIG